MFKGRAFSDDKLTPEMFEQIGRMVDDPNEAWWVKMYAIEALGRADTRKIAAHRSQLMQLLKHESVWIRTAAVVTLCKLAAERDHYKEVLPAVIATTTAFTVDQASQRSFKAMMDAMKNANTDVKNFASPYLKQAYASVPAQLLEPNTGALMSHGSKTIRSRVGKLTTMVPGGEEFVRRIPKTTLVSHISGKDSDMYQYQGFEPNDKVIGTWLWAVWPSPKHPGEVDEKINKWLQPRLGKGPVKIGERPKDTLVIEPNGKISKSKFFGSYFWSGNMLIGNNDGQALQMEVKNYNGVDFLIVEIGGFNPSEDDEGLSDVPADFHCGYHVYMREQQ